MRKDEGGSVSDRIKEDMIVVTLFSKLVFLYK